MAARCIGKYRFSHRSRVLDVIKEKPNPESRCYGSPKVELLSTIVHASHHCRGLVNKYRRTRKYMNGIRGIYVDDASHLLILPIYLLYSLI
jgi:hypothetical protein